MFDLFRSRAKAMRYLLIVLLSMVALSMVITLIPGFGSSAQQTNEQVLAEVGDEVVTTRMVTQVVQMQMRNQQLAPQVVEMAIPQIVNQIVGELATAHQAREMGFTVSDQEVITGIQLMMPQLFQGGTFVGKDVYQQYLAQVNSSIAEFEQKVRQQMLLDKLQRVAFDGIIISPKELDQEFQKRNEKVRLDVVKFDPEDVKKTIQPSRAELDAYLKQNVAMFQIPAKRNLSLIVVDANKLGESLVVSDAMLKQIYESQINRYRQEERVKVRHILVKAEEKASKEVKAKAKEKAEGLLKQIKSGADFAELARKNSDDPGSASKGGDLDWVVRGQMVKPFEDAAFTLKPKEISGLVETFFGYHIVQTTDRQPPRTKPFEDVKAELVSEYRSRQLFDKMPALADQARAELVKAPAQAAEIAKKLGLLHVEVDKIGTRQAYPEIGPNPDLDAALAALPKDGVSPVVQSKNSQLAVAVVREILPPRPAEFSEVEKQIRDVVAMQKARVAAEARAKEFEAKLRANSNNLAKTAQEMKVNIIDTGEFERTGQMKGVGPAAYFGEQPFVNPVGTVIGLYRIGPASYFFRITSRSPGDSAKFETDRAMLVSAIKERKLRERRELFEEGLVRQLKAKGVIKTYDENIKRLASSYKG